MKRMNADIVAMLADAAIKAEQFELLEVLAGGSTPEELAAKARADTELWGPIFKAANIKPD